MYSSFGPAFLFEQDQADLQAKALAYIQRFPDFPRNFSLVSALEEAENPVRHGYGLVICCAVSFAVASVFVWLRLGVRIQKGAFGLDDWMCLLAWVMSFVFTLIQIFLYTLAGVGYHIYVLPFNTLALGLQLAHWDLVMYVISTHCIRFSVVLFLRRLAPPTKQLLRRLIDATLVFQACYAVLVLLFCFLSCSPPSTIWSMRQRLVSYNCLNWGNLLIGLSIVWSILDFWTLVLPIPMVWQLKLPIRQRLAVIVLFLVGLVASVCSVVRLFYIERTFNTWDPFWNAISIQIWDQLEISLGLIAACMPALNVFFVKLVPKRLKTVSKSSSRRYVSGGRPYKVSQSTGQTLLGGGESLIHKQEHFHEERELDMFDSAEYGLEPKIAKDSYATELDEIDVTAPECAWPKQDRVGTKDAQHNSQRQPHPTFRPVQQVSGEQNAMSWSQANQRPPFQAAKLLSGPIYEDINRPSAEHFPRDNDSDLLSIRTNTLATLGRLSTDRRIDSRPSRAADFYEAEQFKAWPSNHLGRNQSRSRVEHRHVHSPEDDTGNKSVLSEDTVWILQRP